jgi:hypothetical protein
MREETAERTHRSDMMSKSVPTAGIIAAAVICLALVAGMAWFFLFRTEPVHADQPGIASGKAQDADGGPLRGHMPGGRRY